MKVPSSLSYKTHFSRQWNCRSLRCSWSIACRRCSNYIFILELTPGFIGLGKDNCKTRRETFKFGDLVRLILEILRYLQSTHREDNNCPTLHFWYHNCWWPGDTRRQGISSHGVDPVWTWYSIGSTWRFHTLYIVNSNRTLADISNWVKV